MFKNVKVLRKENNFKNKYTEPSIEQKLQSSRLIPIGANEVYTYSSIAPIIISGSKIKEFALYCGLSASNNIFTKIAALVSMRVLKSFRKRFDPRRYNGASFLGLKEIVVKSHGGADSLSFANSINIARKAVMEKVPTRIEQHIQKHLVD